MSVTKDDLTAAYRFGQIYRHVHGINGTNTYAGAIQTVFDQWIRMINGRTTQKQYTPDDQATLMAAFAAGVNGRPQSSAPTDPPTPSLVRATDIRPGMRRPVPGREPRTVAWVDTFSKSVRITFTDSTTYLDSEITDKDSVLAFYV